jgi:hypothetical protein
MSSIRAEYRLSRVFLQLVLHTVYCLECVGKIVLRASLPNLCVSVCLQDVLTNWKADFDYMVESTPEDASVTLTHNIIIHAHTIICLTRFPDHPSGVPAVRYMRDTQCGYPHAYAKQ